MLLDILVCAPITIMEKAVETSDKSIADSATKK